MRTCDKEGCENRYYGRGFCKYHYQVEYLAGRLPPLPRIDVKDRFWSRVALTADDSRCWEWTGATNGRGYGQVRTKDKLWATHRFAWTISNGDIPDGLCVLHSCDNPPCCNPNHLRLGTQQENLEERNQKGRQPRGITLATSKLTEDAVREIYARLQCGESPYQIAQTAPVVAATIYSIKKGRTWRHLNLDNQVAR